MPLSYQTKSALLWLLMPVCTVCLSNSDCGGHSSTYTVTNLNGDVTCVPCIKCPPGYGVARRCQDDRDTVCEVCPHGTFSAGSSRSSPCRPCKTCPAHLETTKNCTSKQNAKCAGDCDFAYYLDALSDECSPCSWCFPNNPQVATPRIPQCVDQVMPRNFQCMPSNLGVNVPTYHEYHDNIEVNYDITIQTETAGSARGSVEASQIITGEMTSIQAVSPTNQPTYHHHVIIPIVATSGVIFLVCMVILVYTLVRRIIFKGRRFNMYVNIDDRTSPAVNEDSGVEIGNSNGFFNPIEQHGYNKCSPTDEDAPGDTLGDVTSVQYGKETDDRRCIEISSTSNEKTHIV